MKQKSKKKIVSDPFNLQAIISGAKPKEGRPLKFATAEEMIEKAHAYFRKCLKKKFEPITITGLCMALGTFRNVLMDYQSGIYDKTDPEFSNAVKGIKQVCENYAERMIFIKGNPAGPIFALKNYRWTDTQQVESKKTFDVTGLEELDDDQLDEFIKGLQGRVGKGAH